MALYLQQSAGWRVMALTALSSVPLLSQQAIAPSFEAASVKPAATSASARPAMRGGPGSADPGQIDYTSVTLASVLLRAYDVKTYQVSGPGWLSADRYDIHAKLPAGATREEFRLMLQRLLAERFHLALHRETRQLAGYELVQGRNGSKLKASPEPDSSAPGTEPSAPPKTDTNGYPILTAPGLVFMEGVKGDAVITFLTAKAQPVGALADLLSREFRMPILDRTGLTGKFDFQLEFAPQPPGALPSAPAGGVPSAPEESGANLLAAVPQQLGLRLNPGKIPVEVLVVDRADRVPAEN